MGVGRGGRGRRRGHAAAERGRGAQHGAFAVGVVAPIAQDGEPGARSARRARSPLVAEHDHFLAGIVEGDAALARSRGFGSGGLADLREDGGGCWANGVRLHLVAPALPFHLFFPFAPLVVLCDALALALGFFAPGRFPLFFALDAEAP